MRIGLDLLDLRLRFVEDDDEFGFRMDPNEDGGHDDDHQHRRDEDERGEDCLKGITCPVAFSTRFNALPCDACDNAIELDNPLLQTDHAE